MNVVKIKEFCKEHKKEIALGALGLGAGIICGGKIYQHVKPKPQVNGIAKKQTVEDHISDFLDLLQYSLDNGAECVYRGYVADQNCTVSDLGAAGIGLCSEMSNVSMNDKVIGISVLTKPIES